MPDFFTAPAPEQLAVARQLLKILTAFGIVVAITDYLNGNYITSVTSAFISTTAPLALHLGRQQRYATLPLKFCASLIVGMYLLGAFTQLPVHQEKAVWISVFPFAYFYLTGLRVGTQLSLLSILAMPISYSIFPLFSAAPTITPYGLSQVIGAFLLSAVLAYKYEQIRTKQEILLKHSAECDPLTGLLNRRGFATLSDSAVQHALRSQQSFAVVLIDIDDFKRVNDTQGHEAGDQLLKEIASLLQQYMRSTDITARWGGEEFILLLAYSNLEGSRIVTEKIRSAISNFPFTSGRHTASFGIAFHELNEPLGTTINRADQAMYQAKRNGKNKVEAFLLQPA